MNKTNLTQIGRFGGRTKFFWLLLPLTFFVQNLASQSCDPAAEFSYDASQYCQNANDPVLSHATGADGIYTFSVVSGGPNLALNAANGAISLTASDPGVYEVTNSVNIGGGITSAMLIAGVIDGPLTGGVPKAVEFFVIEDIADLSAYGFSSANNGGGPTGAPEFIFPAVPAAAGDRIWVASETANFNAFFGFDPDYTNGAANINGDDAIELFFNGNVVDVFGDVNVDGSGQPWDYTDGWAYRVDNTGPDGASFALANWTFSGPDALDGETMNSTAATPYPIASYDLHAMVITGVVDGPLTGGVPKAVEFYVLYDIADLSTYGFSSANNGGGPTGAPEFTFPAVSANAGDRIWVASETANFNTFFGFDPDYTNGAANINGDDAIELFFNGNVIDVFGDVNVDGSGEPWEYTDGWAYRLDNTGPDGATFVLANWTFSGPDALDGETTNSAAATPWPIGTYISGGVVVTCTVSIEIVAPPAADAGPNQLVCEGATISLAATGAGEWSGGAGSFSSITDPNAIYTPAAGEIGAIVTLTWTVQGSGGVCQSASDEVNLTILEAADAEFSYAAAEFCPNAANPTVSHVTGIDGLYTYTVISGGPNLDLNPETGEITPSNSDLGTYEVTNTVSGCGNLVISGVIDGPVTGGLPKAVEFYALADIPDLSAYGFGSANNGGGSDGEEFTFPADAIAAGTHFWVATESLVFDAFFGFPPEYVANLAASINGDDAIELFCNGVVIDVFGEINVDGSGQPWEYTDGWAYRFANTGPDGSFFEINNWTFSGPDALDGVATNASAPVPFPVGTFTSNAAPVCSDDSFTQIITINDTEAPALSCPPGGITVTLNPGECAAIVIFNITASDNCDPNPVVTQVDGLGLGSGDFFPIGTYTLEFEAQDETGNISNCSFDVVINEFPNPTSILTCNDLVQASLDQNGLAEIGADMVLEGGPYGCYDDYTVEIFTGIGVSMGNVLDCDDIGPVFTIKVTDPETGNTCWGQITVEDKLPPVINCTDRTVSCTVNIENVLPPSVTDNCDNLPDLNLVELTLVDDDACDNNQVQYRRTWIAYDEYGNESATCQEILTVKRPEFVNFPNDIIWTCDQYAAFPNIVEAEPLHRYVGDSDLTTDAIEVVLDPNCDDNDQVFNDNPNFNSTNVLNGGNGCPGSGLDDADVLALTGSGIPTDLIGEYCQFGFVYNDEIVETCNGAAGVFKIIRTWTVLDWCSGQIVTTGFDDENGNGFQDPGEEDEDNVQVIKVVDETPPVIQASNLTVSANITGIHPQPCRSTGLIPAPVVTDNCTGVAEVHIFTPIGEAVGGQIPLPGLPLGNHVITITAVDACGNFASKDITLTVVDNFPPVAVCDEITDVNLSSDGFAEVFAETFNDGTHDNCCLDHFEVRRMTDLCDDGHNDLAFGPSIQFCCDDVANNPILVVFRAFDCFNNYNECMVQVYVQDKLPPVLVNCPPNERITCDWYADNLETQLALLATADEKSLFLDPFFGEPNFDDNCQPNINRTINFNIDQCLEGAITRTWTATDNGGNTSNPCSQTIFIDHVSDWVVEFPADLTVTCGTQVPEFGEPEIFFETCELVGVSYEDEIFNTVPDACYKILRTWEIINWCVVGTEIDQEVVESSERAFQLAFPLEPCDFDGDGDCDTRTFRDSWRVSPKSKPSAADATQTTNPDTDLDSDPWDGFITYQQTIKVIDNVDPVFANGCDIPGVCIEDNTCVVSLLLPEPEVEECSENVTITAEINIGGVWLSGFGPYANVGPGTYEVRYTAMDNCNNQAECNTTVTVSDCKKPTPYCKNALIVTLMNTNPPMVEVWAKDLDEDSFDNCTAAEDLVFSFTPNVNDQSLTFDCTQIGISPVNIYVTDEAGNQDFCQTEIIVQDNMNACDDPYFSLGGFITNEQNQGVQDVEVYIGGASSGMAMTDADGMYQFTSAVPGGDYTVLPVKDINPLNGVTTLDLVLITKHILGVQLLGSPYKLIAADANKSNSVTTSDLVEIRKLILFINDEFPNNDSWRFVKKNFVFPNPANPWQTQFPELVNMNDITGDDLSVNFTAIKIGDVNGSAQPSLFAGSSDERSNGNTMIFKTDNIFVKKGETFMVPFRLDGEQLAGFQFTIGFDPQVLDFEEVVPGMLSNGNFGFTLLESGVITASWNQSEGTAAWQDGEVFGLTFTAKADGRLPHLLSLNSRFTLAEAYNANLERMKVDLQFGNQLASGPVFELYQNTPNPFSEMTVIGFQLPEAGMATLSFTDVSGRMLKRLEGEFSAGYNELKIRRDELNSSGVVYYRLESQGVTATRRMILMD